MNGELALDTSVAIRFLNGDQTVVKQVINLPQITLPTVVIGELLFGAENSNRSLQNYPRYLKFIECCKFVPISRVTAAVYSRVKLALKLKGRPIPTNDLWIAAQCVENHWILVTDDTDFTYIDNIILERW